MELLKKSESYKVITEEDAISLIKKFRDNSYTETYEVSKASYRKKTKKSKGEVIDEWYVVDVTFTYELPEEE